MPRMLDVSEDVRAEIGDAEADRLLVGDNAPGSYDCTSCRTPGDSEQERTSTVLFVGDETAVLAFAHASCIPSQVVQVAEEQLQGAVRSITGSEQEAPQRLTPEQAVLGITSGLVLIDDELHPALVVEPTGAIARPGSDGSAGDEFLQLLLEQNFRPVHRMDQVPEVLHGWSILLAMGQLHAVLQPGTGGGAPVAWWQAHAPLQVTEGWRTAANKSQTVLVYAAPAGSIGQQPREDLLRDALEKAAAGGLLVAAAMPLAGT
ncbi:hypothetical protein P8A21_08085 [Streptomyces poriferorum]|uniref:Uncharacterized protein n=1 Tax=Streptomyces poriferorum TaxID=2798799 RepID=A0ABY9IX20_9ACTN|nr:MULTISPECIES: hypothetical protein [unclassified Streptomyces]WSQ47304.1 hypothetical protein OG345_32125 [Streptomyces sp. NBC_01220]MDP5311023.1 hypothetical protein [Streptomyces sp. Alt4]WLQ47461.1 hypothetical protein P8A21_08085 [Streptomyces sp. Alt1]WLQ59850.1 hypothetical protein P8A19_32480 [Streptomyces sp. Alt2]WSI62282.1 hypothetical protein OG471_09450 [Streptomyces sp. NBC_01336]